MEAPNIGEEKFLHNLLEKAISISKNENPSWTNILEAMCSISEGTNFLASLDIDCARLKSDLEYSRIFLISNINELSTITKAKEKALFEKDYASANTFRDKEKLLTEANINSTEANTIREEVRANLKEFIKVYQTSTNTKNEILSLIGDFCRDPSNLQIAKNPKIRYVLSEELNAFARYINFAGAKIDIQSIDSFRSFLADRTQDAISATDCLMELQVINRSTMSWVTPRKAFQRILMDLEIQQLYLLYRSGMEAPEGFSPIMEFPKPEIIDIALAAYYTAKNMRAPKVEPWHILLSQLTTYPITMGINAYCKKNPDEIRKALIEKSQGATEQFRSSITITPALNKLLNAIGETKTTRDLTEKYLRKALEAPIIYKTLEESGLEKAKLEEFIKEVLDTVEQKKTTVPNKFEVSNEELEATLLKYGKDLTKIVREQEPATINFRDSEIDSVITILLQAERGNPLLIGEAGVGKSAIFQGLAERIIQGKAPKALAECRVICLDLNQMNAGAMFRGMFEERLLCIVKGVSERNLAAKKHLFVICIDELHSAVSAGSANKTEGAGELLKTHLSGGGLRVIGATTQREYAQHIQKDKALERRFSVIVIGEPSLADAKKIMQERAKHMAKVHEVKYSQTEIDRLVELCQHYIPRLHQPDKSICVLDHAFALTRTENGKKLTRRTIEKAVARLANIDPGFLHMDDHEHFHNLRRELPKAVLGQEAATQGIVKAIFRSRAGLTDPKQPMGVFLLPGPTGVGKTETAKALAKLIFGSEELLTKINMSDYQSEIDFTKLTGAPPGYIGHGEEGALTGAVRKNPHGIILLDEFEKAAKTIQSKLLPIFEEGTMLDGLGQIINFRNCLILITTNLGADTADYQAACKKYFAPEFLNRMTAVIPFDNLHKNTVESLAAREVALILDRAKKQTGIEVIADKSIIEAVATAGFNREMGAREIRRAAMRILGDPLADLVTSKTTSIKYTATLHDDIVSMNAV